MKISIALSLLILGLGSVLGWQDHQRHAKVRASRDKLVAEAAKFGITLAATQKEGGVHVTKREREHGDKEVDAGNTATEFIRFAKEMEAIEKKGSPPDKATQKKSREFMERMMALNPAQLKILIAEVRASKDLNDESRNGLINFSIMTLASDHPQAALALLTESSDYLKIDHMSQSIIFSSLANWAKDDPAAALAWVRANSAKFPDLVDDSAKRGIIAGAAINDPKLAFKLIGEIGIKDGDEAFRNIANAAKTPEERTTTLAALREHLATLPEGEIRDKASKSAFRFLIQDAAEEGFEAGSKWIESAGLNSEQLEETSSLLHSIKREESGRWVEWLGAKLTGEKSKNSIRRLIDDWTENDYQAAGKWLATTPPGPTKNIAIRSYAEAVAQYEPESATQWAMALPPGKDRDETLESIYQNWPANNEVAKEAFKKLHRIK